MKIGFIIPFANIDFSGGVTVQGRMWKEGLEKLGNDVDLINAWDKFEWNSYDYIIILRTGKLLVDYVKSIKKFNRVKLVCAPIIDYHKSFQRFLLTCKYLGSKRFRIYNQYHDLYSCRNLFDCYLVRSNFEGRFLYDGMKISKDKVFTLPLSYRIPLEYINQINYKAKENFCFHSSRLAFSGKNVERLIKAAIKYEFKLVLAGSINGDLEKEWLNSLIRGYDNIEYVGWLSDDDLYSYYRRAKVFALPSIVEGVGMVALEAAMFGCDIILTNIGAPKEYFNNMAYLVNPYDIDDIGRSIQNVLNGNTFQPYLREHILETNNADSCIRSLDKVLRDNLI